MQHLRDFLHTIAIFHDNISQIIFLRINQACKRVKIYRLVSNEALQLINVGNSN